MALFRGASGGLLLVSAKTDSPPAGVYDIREDLTEPGNPSVGPMAGNNGVGAAAKIYQIYPNGGALGASVASGVGLANNVGWQIPPTTYMGSTSSAQRVIRAGTQCIFGVWIHNATSTAAATCTFTVVGFRRSAAGALTQVMAASSTFNIPGLSNAATIGQVYAGTAFFSSDIVFAAGETLYLEYYITIPGQSLGATSLNVNINSTTITSTQRVQFGSAGIAFRYLQALSAGTSVAAATLRNVGAKQAAGLAVAAARRLNIATFRSAGVAIAGALTRRITLAAKQAGVAIAAAIQRRATLAPKQAGVGAAASTQLRVGAFRSAGVAVAGSVVKRVTLGAKAAGVAVAGGFGRFLTVARPFAAGVGVAGSAVLGIPQAVLNRMSGGGAVIKKVFTYIFDD